VTVPISYPGVYIQEEPSAVHTITPVPTSVAAFVGYLPRGPVNQARHVGSWTEFVRNFTSGPGPVDLTVEMNSAVWLFFQNGGSDAEIVRAGSAGAPTETKAKIHIANNFDLEATSEGTWANSFTVAVAVNPAAPAVPNQPPLPPSFNLTINQPDAQNNPTPVETYTGLTAKTVQSKLAASNYFTLSGATTPDMPMTGTYGPPPPTASPSSSSSGAASSSSSSSGSSSSSSGSSSGSSGSSSSSSGVSTSGGAAGTDTPTDVLQLDIQGVNPGAGVHALDAVQIFNILCLPKPATEDYPLEDLSSIASYCTTKRAMLLIDPPTAFADNPQLEFATAATGYPSSANAAIYFPNIQTSDATGTILTSRGPCGAVAGRWAATDAARGVWKAPAGTAASLVGIAGLAALIDDDENGVLNPMGINCLRSFPLVGPVIWGARTCRGADALADQWKYLPVRRTAMFIEESLRRGTQWVVFEPNDETLWAAIRLNVGAFMNSLFSQGAFFGTTPQQAYLVKCDSENNPQNDIDRGIVNILVGFAPLMPAEFVIIHIQQLAGQLQT
jgi:phage tail sheath protein FI